MKETLPSSCGLQDCWSLHRSQPEREKIRRTCTGDDYGPGLEVALSVDSLSSLSTESQGHVLIIARLRSG